MTRNISMERSAAIIKRFEALSLNAYQCPAGVWTIGYGHTRGVKQGQTITAGQADEFLAFDMFDAHKAVSRLVSAPVSLSMVEALTSFVFNIGANNFAESTLLRKLNAKDYIGASDEFPRWCRSGRNVLRGLKRRRFAEAELFCEDRFPN